MFKMCNPLAEIIKKAIRTGHSPKQKKKNASLILHLCTAHVFYSQFLICCFDIVHHPEQQNNSLRPLPETAIVMLRENRNLVHFGTTCHSFTNEAHVNYTVCVRSHMFCCRQRGNEETSMSRDWE